MANIVIKDLENNMEIDRKVMRDLRGKGIISKRKALKVLRRHNKIAEEMANYTRGLINI